MPDDTDGPILLAPLRETESAPPPAFSVDTAVGQVRTIRRRRTVLAGLAAVAVVAAAIVVPPHVGWPGPATGYTAAAAHVTASMREVRFSETDTIMPGVNNLYRLDPGFAPWSVPSGGGELVTGTVNWTPPPAASGMYITVFLFDKDTGKAPIYWDATNTKVAIRADSADGRLVDRYDWLSPIASVPDGWTNFGAPLTVSPSLGSITFAAVFQVAASQTPAVAGRFQLAPVDVKDLTLAVVYHDKVGNGGWAQTAAG